MIKQRWLYKGTQAITPETILYVLPSQRLSIHWRNAYYRILKRAKLKANL